MWPKITTNYSPNFSLPKRAKLQIKFIILHYTGMKKESLAIKKLCNTTSKVSTHYFIKKNGKILTMVPDLYVAWHAGKSSWKKLNSINKFSIGIEIQNSGHNHNYENFTFDQIKSLKGLLKNLIQTYKIDKRNILGHSDIAPYRKKDPGEKFPWKNLSEVKLAKWHNLRENFLKNFRLVGLPLKDKKIFTQNIYKIGFVNKSTNQRKFADKFLVKAFQRRFRQSLINGIIDKECFIISKNLLKK